MEQLLGQATSIDDLLEILRNNPEKIHGLNLSQGILEAIKQDNWITAKNIAMIYVLLRHNYISTYSSREEMKNAVDTYEKTIGPFSWLQLFNFSVRRGSSAADVDLVKALLSANKIAFWELYETFISRETLRWLESLPFSPLSDPNISAKTIIYKIITSNKMKRVQRFRLMTKLAADKVLSLDPIGPENLSPPLLCIKYRILHLIPFFTRLPGFEKVRSPEGYNFNLYLGLHYPQPFRMGDFTPEDFKIVILKHPEHITMEKIVSQNRLNTEIQSAYCRALRELYFEKKLNLGVVYNQPEKLLGRYGAHYFYQLGAYSDSNPDYKKADHTFKKPIEKLVVVPKKNGRFNFDELPEEILELIVTELDILSQCRLFLTSKWFVKKKKTLHNSFYATLMQKQFQVSHSSLIANATISQKHNWNNIYEDHCRQYLGYDFNNQEPKLMEHPMNHSWLKLLDDNWLMMDAAYFHKVTFWDCHSHKIYNLDGYISEYSPNCVNFLESRPGELPIVVQVSKNLVTLQTFDCKDQTIAKKEVPVEWNDHSRYLEVLSKDTIMVGDKPAKIHIETGQVTQLPGISEVKDVAHNKVTQLMIASTKDAKVVLMDKNGHMIQKHDIPEAWQANWITQELLIAQSYGGFKVFDIRKFDSPTFEFTQQAYVEHISQYRGGYHAITMQHREEMACVWDLRSGSWTKVFSTPDISQNNSRYAVGTRYSLKGTKVLFIRDFKL